MTYEVDMSEEQRRRGFMKAEASLRLEGIDPSGSPRYESIKARVISGEITYEQGRAEILAFHTGKRAEPTTAGEMLAEEFLKPLNMSQGELAQATGIPEHHIDDIISNRRHLSAQESYKLAEQFQTDKDFWLNLQALHDAWLTHQR